MPSKTDGGGAWKPNQAPTDEKGRANAAARAVSEEAVSAAPGRSCQGRPFVRMTKITRICVAMDSRNHAVRNSSAETPKTRSSTPKVTRSNSDESGPITLANRRTPAMSQTWGREVADESTRSKGM